MKSEKLSMFIANRDMKKRHMAKLINTSPSQLSRFIKSGDYYIQSDFYNNYSLVKKVADFTY
jgi:hypothetical protein